MRSNVARHHVYYNLHKSVWSVMLRGKLIGHEEELVVKDAIFRVRGAGRARVLETLQKNVHAFVVGDIAGPASLLPAAVYLFKKVPIHYNPYINGYFYDKITGQEVLSAKYVYMNKDRSVDAYGVKYHTVGEKKKYGEKSIAAVIQRLVKNDKWRDVLCPTCYRDGWGDCDECLLTRISPIPWSEVINGP